ncbi:MAG: HAMP domain-containing sensor histidine kinase [Pseudomonadota bacterium]
MAQNARLSLLLLAFGVAATLAAAELARRAAADDFADFAMVDFVTQEIAGALSLCPEDDQICRIQVSRNEERGVWRVGAQSSFTHVVSDFADGSSACAREAERRIRRFALYTCRIEGAAYRVAQRPALTADEPAPPGASRAAMLLALELAEWEAAAEQASRRLVGGRSLSLAVAVMAASLILVLAVSLFAVRRSLARHFSRLGAELEAYRAGAATRIDGRYPSEIQELADSLNRAIEKKNAVLSRQRRNVAKMAHDLRHQLVAIDLAAREATGEQERETAGRTAPEADAADGLSAELEALGAMVERYLTLSDWVGPAEGAPPADVNAALQAARAAFARRLRLEPVEIAVRGADGVTALAHPADLRIILSNLVGNAHRHAKSRIELSAERVDAAWLEIAVDDDGPGVPEAQRAHALAWGRRLDAGPAGSGFGLAIVAEQVGELYGGAVRLETAPLGGLRAVVRLPAAPHGADGSR